MYEAMWTVLAVRPELAPGLSMQEIWLHDCGLLPDWFERICNLFLDPQSGSGSSAVQYYCIHAPRTV